MLYVFCNYIYIFILMFFIMYLLLAHYTYKYYFYKDKIKIVYFLKFRKRIIYHNYNDIKFIVYKNIGARGTEPEIILSYDEKRISQISKPSNSFTHICFKKRQEILKFLQSKGIPIKIDSFLQKDKNILN